MDQGKPYILVIDDEAEMRQHIDPQWRRVLPRW